MERCYSLSDFKSLRESKKPPATVKDGRMEGCKGGGMEGWKDGKETLFP